MSNAIKNLAGAIDVTGEELAEALAEAVELRRNRVELENEKNKIQQEFDAISERLEVMEIRYTNLKEIARKLYEGCSRGRVHLNERELELLNDTQELE